MGAYIYGLRSPKHVTEITLPDGRKVQAGHLKYSHKPTSSFWDAEPLWQRAANARLAKVEKAWAGKSPEFAIVVSKDQPEDGLCVLDWHHQRLYLGDRGYADRVTVGVTSTYDDPDWGGRKSVGMLKRVGGAWHVVPTVYEERPRAVALQAVNA